MSEQLDGMDLGKYLEQHRAGGVRDSEGGFTVSHKNAARKLARFALPRPYAWVVKIVQAAVAWQCRELRIHQSTTQTQFQFLTDHLRTLPTEQDLVSVMLSGKIGEDSPLECFCVGLRSLVEQANLSFMLVIDDGEVTPKPVYAGWYFGGVSERERRSTKYRPGPGMTLTVAHIPPTEEESRFLVSGKYQQKILQELEQYCFLCPIPIQFDARRLDGLLRASPYTSSGRYRPLLVSGCRAEEESVLPLPVGFGERQLSVLTHPLKALRTHDTSGRFSVVGLVGLHVPRLLSEVRPTPRRRSSIHWVRHGVVVGSSQLPVLTHCLGCDFFLNGEGLKTDLTGFQLVESELRTARETTSIRALINRISETDFLQTGFQEDRDEDSSSDDEHDAQAAVKKRVKILLKGGAGGLALTLFSPPLAIPATLVGLVAAFIPRKDKVSQQLVSLRTHFQAIMDMDRTALVETFQNWTCLAGDVELPEQDSGPRQLFVPKADR